MVRNVLLVGSTEYPCTSPLSQINKYYDLPANSPFCQSRIKAWSISQLEYSWEEYRNDGGKFAASVIEPQQSTLTTISDCRYPAWLPFSTMACWAKLRNLRTTPYTHDNYPLLSSSPLQPLLFEIKLSTAGVELRCLYSSNRYRIGVERCQILEW